LSKKTPQLKWRGPKKGKKGFFEKYKVPDCGPTSAARELKKEVLWGLSPRIIKNMKKSKKTFKKKLFRKFSKKFFFLPFSVNFFLLFCNICTLGELPNASDPLAIGVRSVLTMLS
jgi:hypothetical protein